MKAWLRSITGAIFASLLTITLNGKAYAEPDDQTLPDEPPTQIIEPGESADTGELFTLNTASASASNENGADPIDPDTSSPAPLEEAGASVEDLSPGDSPTGSEDNNVFPEAGDNAASGTEASTSVTVAAAADEAEQTEVPGDLTDTTLPAAAADTAPDSMPSSAEASEESGPVVAEIPDAEVMLFSSEESPMLMAVLSNENETGSDTDPGTNNVTEPTRGGSSSDTSLTQTENGIYIMVNHTGSEDLNTEGDITILAAGVNRVSSIIGTGKVQIAGTGILLVDSLQGDLELLTLTDIYDEGSVAVFVRQTDSSYKLVNGVIPGILDEEYRIEGCTLVIPKGGKLLICGTGAEPLSDGSVAYYHGTDHGYQAEEFHNVVEMTGKLTIAERAQLIIQRDASVILQNLKTLGHGDYTDDGLRHSALSIENGGKLTVNGTVGNDGTVWIGEDCTLTGNGSITTDKLTIADPSAIEDSHVSLSADNLYLYGSGTIAELKIADTIVHPGNNTIKINGLVNSGRSLMVLPAAFELNIAKIDGTLTLRQNCEHYTMFESHQYKDENKVSISGADIRGSGTISFDSGIYVLQAGTKLNKVTVSDTAGGIVYDYAGVLAPSLFPLHMQPANLPYPTADGDTMVIPVVVASQDEGREPDGGYSTILRNTYPDFITVSADVYATENGQTVTLDLDKLKADLTEKSSALDGIISLEFLRKSTDGTLHTDFYSMSDLSGSINADDLCLIRILSIRVWEYTEPDSESTMTGMTYTGSGILGGSGAGSIHFGRTDTSPSGDNGSGNSNNTSDNTGSDNGSSSEDNNGNNSSENDNDSSSGSNNDIIVENGSDNDDESEIDPDKPASADLEIWTTQESGVYTLYAKDGEQTVSDLDGYVEVFMDYTPPSQSAGKTFYVVFRDDNGKLVAFRASYGQITKKLYFRTTQLGKFVILCFDFDGEDFSEAFYEALEAFAEIAALN